MKVILSRKGFDSSYGGTASPILPDGTLLSLPIPSKAETVKFTDLHYDGQSYYDIVKSLKPTVKIKEKYACHLDPDLRRDVISRLDGWRPAFGQEGAALSHLQNQCVGVGDLFLFYGWFKQAELRLVTGRAGHWQSCGCSGMVTVTSAQQPRKVGQQVECYLYCKRQPFDRAGTLRSRMSALF